MFFLMFKDCRERRLGGGEHDRRPLTSCGLRGIAAANVGIFAETGKQKRRFVPNLRTGGANCFLSRLREAMRPLPSCGRCSRRARPVYRRAEWRAKARNFSMLFGRLGQNLGLSEICSQVVTTTSAIFFASSRPLEAPDFE